MVYLLQAGGKAYKRSGEEKEVPEGYGQRGRGSECLANLHIGVGVGLRVHEWVVVCVSVWGESLCVYGVAGCSLYVCLPRLCTSGA